MNTGKPGRELKASNDANVFNLCYFCLQLTCIDRLNEKW